MEARRHLTDDERAEVLALLDEARRADGHEPLAEHKRIRLEHGGDGGFVAFLHRAAGGRLAGYAQLAPATASTGLEVVVGPADRGAAGVDRALVQAAVDETARGGGGTLRYFLSDPDPDRVAAAAALGFRPERRLVHLAVALPLPPATVASARDALAGLTVRAFRPGHDEGQWLDVNARAFAAHPEQGAWTMEDLLDREAAPWFDPAGFVVAEADGRVVASCLTKVHGALDPPAGEIYVISVDPAWHGRGLGRAMTVAGLDHLASLGLRRGVLYVDDDNATALRMYEALGFAVDHVDLAYVMDVDQAPETPTALPMP